MKGICVLCKKEIVANVIGLCKECFDKETTIECFYCGRIADEERKGHYHIGKDCAEDTGCCLCDNPEIAEVLKYKYFCSCLCECNFLKESIE